jgi:hypothetical protein
VEREKENRKATGRPYLQDIAPEVVGDSLEVVTDNVIDELMRHRDIDHDRIAALQESSAECQERVRRLLEVFPQIDEFLILMEDTFPKTPVEDLPEGMHEISGDRVRVRKALVLMLKVHINQSNRISNEAPFISHPLAVAREVLDTYQGNARSHVVAAALLHDSIEDQSRLLALEKLMLADNSDAYRATTKQLEREGALHGLGHIFGLHTQMLVRSVTSPEILKTDIPKRDKEAVYEQYIKDIFKNDEFPGAAVIKWADLQENALTVGEIYERSQREVDPGDQEKYLALYRRLRDKWEPALRVVRSFFQQVKPDHPLYEQREDAMRKIDEALDDQYRLA